MVAWSAVSAFLESNLISQMADKKKGSEWLKSLESSPLGPILGINVYVDLRCKYLDKSAILEILNQMSDEITDGRRSLLAVVLNNQDEYLCTGLRGEALEVPDRYIRVMPLYRFVKYYGTPALDVPVNEEGRMEVLENFFEKPKGERTKMGLITQSWQGSAKNTWVTSLKEFEKRTHGFKDDEKADFANDVLSLSLLAGEIVVYVAYPTGIDADRFAKPTTLDACGENCKFFVSIKSHNGWGKTCSQSGTLGLPERVHKAMDGLSDDFEGEKIGKTSRPMAYDYGALLEEALKRADAL